MLRCCLGWLMLPHFFLPPGLQIEVFEICKEITPGDIFADDVDSQIGYHLAQLVLNQRVCMIRTASQQNRKSLVWLQNLPACFLISAAYTA